MNQRGRNLRKPEGDDRRRQRFLILILILATCAAAGSARGQFDHLTKGIRDGRDEVLERALREILGEGVEEATIRRLAAVP